MDIVALLESHITSFDIITLLEKHITSFNEENERIAATFREALTPFNAMRQLRGQPPIEFVIPPATLRVCRDQVST